MIKRFDDGTLFSYGSEVDGEEFALMTGSSAGNIVVQLYGASADTDLTIAAAADGGWHHYCLTYDGTSWSLYFDGLLEQSSAEELNTGEDRNLKVGCRSVVGSTAADCLEGRIDDLYVYESALDAVAAIEARLASKPRGDYLRAVALLRKLANERGGDGAAAAAAAATGAGADAHPARGTGSAPPRAAADPRSCRSAPRAPSGAASA